MRTNLNKKFWFVAVQTITILRVVLAFIFIVLAPLPDLKWFASAAYFFALSTDFLDGRLARAKGVASQIGGAMDIFGDRYLLVISCLYAGFKGVSFGVLAIILVRELFSVAMKMVTYRNKPIVVSNRKIGGAVHTMVGIGVLCIVLRPTAPIDFLSNAPFVIVAVFYCVYFPVTLYKSRQAIAASINADLQKY